MDNNYYKYTKRHLKIFQNGQTIFNQNVYVCLEHTQYVNYESPYYYYTDRNKRVLKVKMAEDDKDLSYINLGLGDTFFITVPPTKETGI